MGRKAALLVLPGLDGTAGLHAPFIAALGTAWHAITVVRYPHDQQLDYPALEALVRAALPTDVPFVLLGESFSGPIAVSIAANPPANLIGLVLSTTFARAPLPLLSPFAAIGQRMPVSTLPMPLLRWLLFGRWASAALLAQMKSALQQVEPAVLRHRAALTLQVDATSQLSRIAVPVLYLRALHDRLIRAASARQILARVDDARLVELAGPHMLLQACPQTAAAAVLSFAAQLQGSNE